MTIFKKGLYMAVTINTEGEAFPLMVGGLTKDYPTPLMTLHESGVEGLKQTLEESAHTLPVGYKCYVVRMIQDEIIAEIALPPPRKTLPCPACQKLLSSELEHPPIGKTFACPHCTAYLITTEGPGLRMLTADEVLALPSADLARLTARRAEIRSEG